MANFVTSAGKLQRKAMKALYEANKAKVYFVAEALTDDPKTANEAVVWTFKHVWGGIAAENIATESAFTELAIRKACDYCKKVLLKKDSRAYKIPENRNFAVIGTVKGDDVIDGVYSLFTPLQKLILMLDALKVNKKRASALCKTDEKTFDHAVSAMAESIERISNGQASYNSVAEGILKRELIAKVSNAADTAVYNAIDDISAPIVQKQRKNILIASVCVVIAAILTVCGILLFSGDDSEFVFDKDAIYQAEIVVKDYGTIKVELDSKTAPITVENFVTLASDGFYDGLTFHRIIDGFMIQGGDPLGNGLGGADKDIIGEFSANGYENNISHKRGVISMARSSAGYNTASSQFFIMHKDETKLDGQYAAFGYVIAGMNVVDAICADSKPLDDNGKIAAEDQPIIEKVRVYKVSESSLNFEPDGAEIPDESKITHYAEIVIKDYGTIKLALDGTTAPITVNNFVNLANSGFYDGLTFHRIIEGFMMQGGDPLGNGYGGADEDIIGEFSANGYKNDISHKRGVISMGRESGGYDTASSQFFIVHKDSTGLDGQYAAFGYVTEGLSVVDAICESARPIDGNGKIADDQKPIIEKITVTMADGSEVPKTEVSDTSEEASGDESVVSTDDSTISE